MEEPEAYFTSKETNIKGHEVMDKEEYISKYLVPNELLKVGPFKAEISVIGIYFTMIQFMLLAL